MIFTSSQTYSNFITGTGYYALMQTERAVSYFAKSVILAMVIPILGFFTVDFATFAVKSTMHSIQNREKKPIKKIDFTFKSTSLVRQYFQDLSARIQLSRLRFTKFGIRVEDE